ncbi:hypothetical protein Q3G72_031390 [Acer saccharum]|nr:hypothetical protein Q3G72_031390 [Acer saccharum]
MMLQSVVTISLGHISNNQADSSKNSSSVPNNKLQEFWTPFLLVHLGGPDTITAYSLEDNNMWLRYLLVHSVHVGTAFYIFVQAWEKHPLMFIAIPILISGLVNYGGRTLALRSSSTQCLKDGLFSDPDPCSDFVKHVEKDHLFEGDRDHQDRLMEEGSSSSVLSVMVLPQDGIDDPKDHRLVEAYFMFKRLEYLFVGLVLDYYERIGIYSIIRDKSAEDSFKLVAIELGFMYDTLYTKATVVCSRFGIVFRCISFFSSVSAVVVFSVMNLLFHRYSKTDIFLTYSLLAGAVFVEVYAIMVLFYSDWTRLWLIKCKKAQHNLVSKFLVDHLWRFSSPSHSLVSNKYQKRWSGSMSQFNLISYCLENTQHRCTGVQKLPCFGKWLEIYRYLTRVNVNADLQELIFNQLKKKGDILKDTNVSYVVLRNEFLAHRGDNALKIQQHLGDRFHWSITEVDFDQSLLIWHIATDVCYLLDLDHVYGDENKLHLKCKISKYLSDYMLYLLVFCPSMLPKGPIGERRYKETCTEAMEFFEKRRNVRSSSKKCDAFKELLHGDTLKDLLSRSEREAKGPRSRRRNQSVLYQGCKLAKQFLELGTQSNSNSDENGSASKENWEIISEVWVELLAYAAHHCGWKAHCEQLRNGGELLTHVCLLMVHLGLSKQFVDTI